MNFTLLKPSGEQTLVFNNSGFRKTQLISEGYLITDPKQPGEIVFEEMSMTPASCQLYAIHDGELNNSQFMVMNFLGEQGTYQVSDFRELGPLYEGFDFESVAIHPETDVIYAALSRDVTASKHLQGYLYTIDAQTGHISPIGDTGFKAIEELAFAPDGSLWAWAKRDGLITIELMTGAGQLQLPSDALIGGLTLRKNADNRTVFYASTKRELWEYDLDANTVSQICSNLPRKIEALCMVSDELLLLGLHKKNATSVRGFNPQTCQIVDMDISTSQFNDIEAIALPVNACQP